MESRNVKVQLCAWSTRTGIEVLQHNLPIANQCCVEPERVTPARAPPAAVPRRRYARDSSTAVVHTLKPQGPANVNAWGRAPAGFPGVHKLTKVPFPSHTLGPINQSSACTRHIKTQSDGLYPTFFRLRPAAFAFAPL